MAAMSKSRRPGSANKSEAASVPSRHQSSPSAPTAAVSVRSPSSSSSRSRRPAAPGKASDACSPTVISPSSDSSPSSSSSSGSKKTTKSTCSGGSKKGKKTSSSSITQPVVTTTTTTTTTPAAPGQDGSGLELESKEEEPSPPQVKDDNDDRGSSGSSGGSGESDDLQVMENLPAVPELPPVTTPSTTTAGSNQKKGNDDNAEAIVVPKEEHATKDDDKNDNQQQQPSVGDGPQQQPLENSKFQASFVEMDNGRGGTFVAMTHQCRHGDLPDDATNLTNQHISFRYSMTLSGTNNDNRGGGGNDDTTTIRKQAERFMDAIQDQLHLALTERLLVDCIPPVAAATENGQEVVDASIVILSSNEVAWAHIYSIESGPADRLEGCGHGENGNDEMTVCTVTSHFRLGIFYRGRAPGNKAPGNQPQNDKVVQAAAERTNNDEIPGGERRRARKLNPDQRFENRSTRNAKVVEEQIYFSDGLLITRVGRVLEQLFDPDSDELLLNDTANNDAILLHSLVFKGFANLHPDNTNNNDATAGSRNSSPRNRVDPPHARDNTVSSIQGGAQQQSRDTAKTMQIAALSVLAAVGVVVLVVIVLGLVRRRRLQRRYEFDSKNSLIDVDDDYHDSFEEEEKKVEEIHEEKEDALPTQRIQSYFSQSAAALNKGTVVTTSGEEPNGDATKPRFFFMASATSDDERDQEQFSNNDYHDDGKYSVDPSEMSISYYSVSKPRRFRRSRTFWGNRRPRALDDDEEEEDDEGGFISSGYLDDYYYDDDASVDDAGFEVAPKWSLRERSKSLFRAGSFRRPGSPQPKQKEQAGAASRQENHGTEQATGGASPDFFYVSSGSSAQGYYGYKLPSLW